MAITEKHIMGRLYVLACILTIFVGVLIFKLIDVQAIEGKHYKALALQKTERIATIPPIRGNIFAADGSLLAASVAKYTVHLDALVASESLWQQQLQPLCDSLAVLFNKPVAYYTQKLSKARDTKNRHLLLAKNINYPEFVRMRDFPLLKYHPFTGGIKHTYKVVRQHPLGELAWRSIGYEKVDQQGYYTRVGLDGAFGKDYLRGVVGKRLEQKSGGNVWKPVTIHNMVEPQNGMDLVTTLNTNMQDIAHHELLKQLQKYDANHGCVVVMEVQTGAIKAIANLGKNKDGQYVERRNYAVWESHEPGSTFKLMSLMAALEDNKIDTNTVFDTYKGRYKLYDKYVRDSRWGGYGKISVANAFAVSSNTVFAQLVHENYKDQPKQFVNRLRNFKLHQTLDLPINGEGKPKIRYPGESGWSGLSLAWMSHGYEVSLTPLQTLTFYNAIANNGTMVKPRFAKEVRLGNQIIKSFKTQVLMQSIASKKNVTKAKDLLTKVVGQKNGTGHKLYDPNFSMAGKTGTCWKNYGANVEERDYISSFAGYFPAKDPKYSCIVVIHEPNQEKGIYGADVAGPVFKSMAQKIYLTSPVVETVPETILTSNQLENNYEQYYNLAQKSYTTMPNLLGLSGMDAIALLENLGLTVVIKGSGKVIQQSVPKGTKINSVKQIKLILS